MAGISTLIKKISGGIVRIARGLLQGYRFFVSPWLGHQCRFFPSCSQYAEQALGVYGVIRGSWLASCRLMRCHPWALGGVDEVPVPNEKKRNREI